MGLRRLTEILEAKDAILYLDKEIEAFILAVRQDDLDLRSDKELLNLFCKLANHRNTTPLVKDWVTKLHDDYHRYVFLIGRWVDYADPARGEENRPGEAPVYGHFFPYYRNHGSFRASTDCSQVYLKSYRRA